MVRPVRCNVTFHWNGSELSISEMSDAERQRSWAHCELSSVKVDDGVVRGCADVSETNVGERRSERWSEAGSSQEEGVASAV